MVSSFFVFVALLVGILVGYLFFFIKNLQNLRGHRSDAIKKSKSVILGHVNEKILPMIGDFPYNPKDLVFVGKGFDYLILDGLSSGQLDKIIFLELKTGSSQLNQNEKMIKNVIDRKHVSYEIWRR